MFQPLAQSAPESRPPLARYETALRVIGRHLDLHGCRQTALFETAAGFIARAVVSDARAPVAFEFRAEELTSLLERARSSRGKGVRSQPGTTLAPTGYEDLLRALGHHLDQRDAAGVIIVELCTAVVVSGVETGEVSDKLALVPFEEQLHPNDIERLLDDAFHRRTRDGR